MKNYDRLLTAEVLPLVQETLGLQMPEAEGGWQSLSVTASGPPHLALLGLAGLLGSLLEGLSGVKS